MCLLVVDSTVYARPVCFLLPICTNHVRALVLLDGEGSALHVIDVVLCACAVALIAGSIVAL